MGWIERWFESLGIQKSRVAIYARASSEIEANSSLGAQLQACRKYCNQRGWADVEEYIETPDATPDDAQPELERLLSAIQNGKPIHTVVADTRDRLAANPDRLVEIEKLLQDHSGQLVVVKHD